VKFTDGFCSRSAKSINNRVQFPLNSKLIYNKVFIIINKTSKTKQNKTKQTAL